MSLHTGGCRRASRLASIGLSVLVAAIAAPQAAHADMVVTWMNLADQALDKAWQQDPRGYRTEKNTRGGAQVSLAVFEAVNAIDRRYRSYLHLPAAEPGASTEAAAAAAAHAVLCALLPAQKPTLDDALVVSLAQVPDGPGEAAGVTIGRQAAAAAMTRAALTPGTTLTAYRPHTAAGVYIDPGLPSIRPFDVAMPPFVLESATDVRPAAPPALPSATYARDLDEVRRLGAKDSTDRSADKTLLAQAWLEIDYTRIVEDVARRPGRSLVDNARLYAMVDVAAEDTWLAVMEAKMHFGTWRPITAIRNADQDGNDATTRDADWEPLLRTPTHPDYPCGHCGNAAAIATVLETATGPTPAAGIRLHTSLENAGLVVTLPTWQAFVDEMSMSRIYAGAHTRTANDVAEAMGREVARRALATVMTPLSANTAAAR